jgi:hypothetical protein
MRILPRVRNYPGTSQNFTFGREIELLIPLIKRNSTVFAFCTSKAREKIPEREDRPFCNANRKCVFSRFLRVIIH